VLSVGASARDLALGKTVGIAAALAVVLVPAAIVGVAALALTSDGGFLASSPSRAAWLAAFYLIYFAIIAAVSLGVSARARSSRLALVVLLSFWFANSVVASRVVADLASWLHPTPSAIEFQQAMETGLNDQRELQARLERRKAELLQQHHAASLDAVPIAFSGVSLQEGENHGNEVFDDHYGRLFDIYERQNRVYQLGGAIAPTLAMRAASMALAGTDFAQHRDFLAAAESYRRRIQRTLNEDIMAHPTAKGGVYLAGRELWEQVPAFAYDAPGTAWVLGRIRWSVGMLLAWLVAAVIWMTRPLATDAI
jgi:ABC-2 type transport system permease protein